MARKIGILTAGGDSPGLNAAIRAVGKAAQRAHGMEVLGFNDGFLGLMQDRFVELEATRSGGTGQLASTLAGLTGLESRITILGHVQRGGTPTPADRLLATRLGTACTDYIADRVHGVLVAARGESTEAVPLKKVAGHDKVVPLDHPWVETARHLGVALGD